MIEKPVKGAAKAAGAAKQARARLTRAPGVLNTLAKEHGEVSALIGLIKVDRKAGRHMRDDKVMERVRLLDELVFELLSHSIAEDEHVYSALERIPEARQPLQDAREEHHRMEELLYQLLSIPYSSDRWLQTFERFQDLVSHHVEEEESTLFDLARQHLSKDELQRMDQRFKQEKQEQLKRLPGEAFSLPRGN